MIRRLLGLLFQRPRTPVELTKDTGKYARWAEIRSKQGELQRVEAELRALRKR